jgi:hypothetical protein
MTSISLLNSLLQDYQRSVSSTLPSSPDPISTETQNTSNYSNACIVDISKAAQDILNQQGSKGSGSIINLNDSQKQKLGSILAKYKDAPINNDTLSALDADLQKAGLTPDQLASIQEALSFNPTKVFLQLLGDSSNNSDSSPTEGALSILGSSATNSPIGELQDQLFSVSQKV